MARLAHTGRPTFRFTASSAVLTGLVLVGALDPAGLGWILLVFGARIGLLMSAVVVHEWAHGMAAYLMGDATAKESGRLTLNPVPHLDAWGLVIVPLGLAALGSPVLIGWAKPVPVDFHAFARRRLGSFLVSAAGPLANFAAAAAGAAALRLCGVDGTEGIASALAWEIVALNLALGLFNLLPVFPMDGGRMVASLLPLGAFEWLERRERRAALLALAALVGLPWAASAVGVEFSPLAPVYGVYEQAVAAAYGSDGRPWSDVLSEATGLVGREAGAGGG